LKRACSTGAPQSFNGRRALMQEKERGPSWLFVGIEVDFDSLEKAYAQFDLRPALPITAWRTSIPLYRNGTQIGYASSGVWSPLLKKYISLAHVQAPHYAAGTAVEMEVTIEHSRQRVGAQVVKTPFYNPERKRI
jgi:glycine cleavage system T protein (aminomethyltransferase)